MQSGNHDKAESKRHQIKGKIKAVIGKTVHKRVMKSVGKVENGDGKM